MITKEEIIEIIHKRNDRIEKWLKNNPGKLSLNILKQELKQWGNEIDDAQKLSKENDPLFPEQSLGTVYTFMNTSAAIQANYAIALVYIKKLEKEPSKQKSTQKKSKTNLGVTSNG